MGFMKVIDALLRAYASLYLLGISAFLAGIAGVAYLTGVHNINTGGMLNFSGQPLTNCLLAMGLLGVASAVLSWLGGWWRFLLPLYALGTSFTLFRWFFASAYHFGSREAFDGALWLFAGSLGALFSSLVVLKRSGRGSRRIK
jgi:hypothetical protein